jgi:hypothetical protein
MYNIPKWSKRVEKILANFRQWSDLSPGYSSARELLDSCTFDENGLVNCPAKIIDLTGEAWVAAAHIYLQCRCYRHVFSNHYMKILLIILRRPRTHPNVLKRLNVLLKCVERMPSSGNLFTSQSSFFPIFIMGVISVREGDRKVARHWLETVVSSARSRSVSS